jgi:alcohol dehydrogenase class IV
MWFFKAPEFYFGDSALSHLRELRGERAFIVTDANIVKLGLVDLVCRHLDVAGIAYEVFDEVEPDPSIQTVRRGAERMLATEPDWIIGLGGGSSMDAAKAMWILYERPDMEPEEINPWSELGLRQKARLITIPTTAGTGSESNYGIVLTDTEEHRKLTLGARESTPDLAIVDPAMTAHLPRQITADTGIDVLSHAIEAYSCNWSNDFTDGLAIQAARMVFHYLERAVNNGAEDPEAREKMANAAAIVGITLGNSSVALAHAYGHSAGAYFKQIPHGRITAIFLPATIEYITNGGVGRYQELAQALALPAETEEIAGRSLATAVRDLMRSIGLPVSLQDAGVTAAEMEPVLEEMVYHVEIDANTLQSRRMPETDEVEKLFAYAFDGREVDF